MSWSWVSILSFFIMAVILLTRGPRRSILHPIFLYCAYTIYVYQYVDDRMNVDAFSTNAVILISFMVTMLFYTLFYLMKLPILVKNIQYSTNILSFDFIKESSRKIWYIGTALVFTYVFINLWYYAKSLGSFEQALIRFYAHLSDITLYSENTQSGTILKVLSYLSKLCIAYIGILRIAKHFGKIDVLTFWVTAAIVVINGFSSGSRGLIALPIMFIVSVDMVMASPKKLSFPVKLDTSLSIIIAVALFLLLGQVRNLKFDNINDLMQYAKEERWLKPNNDFSCSKKYDRENNIRYIDHCLKSYPEKAPFLNFHTFFSILVNPIPRLVWNDKPIGFGKIMALHSFGLWNPEPKHMNMTASSFSAGISGEGYSNFGLTGVIIFSAVFGAISGIFAKLSKKLIYSNSAISIIVGLLFLKGSFSFVRGAMLDNLFHTLYPVLMIIIIAKLFKFLSSFKTIFTYPKIIHLQEK